MLRSASGPSSVFSGIGKSPVTIDTASPRSRSMRALARDLVRAACGCRSRGAHAQRVIAVCDGDVGKLGERDRGLALGEEFLADAGGQGEFHAMKALTRAAEPRTEGLSSVTAMLRFVAVRLRASPPQTARDRQQSERQREEPRPRMTAASAPKISAATAGSACPTCARSAIARGCSRWATTREDFGRQAGDRHHQHLERHQRLPHPSARARRGREARRAGRPAASRSSCRRCRCPSRS